MLYCFRWYYHCFYDKSLSTCNLTPLPSILQYHVCLFRAISAFHNLCGQQVVTLLCCTSQDFDFRMIFVTRELRPVSIAPSCVFAADEATTVGSWKAKITMFRNRPLSIWKALLTFYPQLLNRFYSHLLQQMYCFVVFLYICKCSFSRKKPLPVEKNFCVYAQPFLSGATFYPQPILSFCLLIEKKIHTILKVLC